VPSRVKLVTKYFKELSLVIIIAIDKMTSYAIIINVSHFFKEEKNEQFNIGES